MGRPLDNDRASESESEGKFCGPVPGSNNNSLLFVE